MFSFWYSCSIQKMPRLLVAAQDGYLYMYNLDPVEGGECTLLKQHRQVQFIFWIVKFSSQWAKHN